MAQDMSENIKSHSPIYSDATGASFDQNISGFETVDSSNPLLFRTPPTAKGTIIDVYAACKEGNCRCVHLIGGKRAQLLPCRFANYLWGGANSKPDENWELFCGIVDGFDVVDSEVRSYDCSNYSSILEGEARKTMERSIREDLEEGRISKADSTPTCIHSLGAVPKAGGGYRTITDCSRPSGESQI